MFKKRPNFDDLPKTGNYITPEEIGEIGERQQLTTEAKRRLFYRAELLNGGQVLDGGRSAARSTETG